MGDGLDIAYAGLRHAWTTTGGVPMPERVAALRRLRATMRSHGEDFVATLDADVGGRSRHETLIAEIVTILGAIDHALPRLRGWAKPRPIPVGWRFWPARARLIPQPRGVVGILGPANFPVQLAVLPLIGAIAAGCRVLLKGSELTPATTALLGRCLADVFSPDHVTAVEGGADVAEALTRLPLDHLLFTGSTAHGHRVMAAAAAHLTPLTLELGGKSPAVVARSADLGRAARAIMAGKLMNAGQTCVAPDHVYVPRQQVDAFVAAAVASARSLYPDGAGTTAVRDAAARERLAGWLVGERVVELFAAPPTSPRVAPVLVIDPAPGSPLRREEIFGPVLPILPYDTFDEVIAGINAGPRPLALYWFGPEDAELAWLIGRTASGAVSVNETVLHAAVEALPFGGIGASGMGAYHGRAGFDTFSHARPVFTQSRFSPTRLLRPPYQGARAERILKMLLR